MFAVGALDPRISDQVSIRAYPGHRGHRPNRGGRGTLPSATRHGQAETWQSPVNKHARPEIERLSLKERRTGWGRQHQSLDGRCSASGQPHSAAAWTRAGASCRLRARPP